MIFDSGMPLGPGLLATWVPLPDPNAKNANVRKSAAIIATNVPASTLPLRSLFDMWFSFVSRATACFGICNQHGHFDGSVSGRSLGG